MPTSVQRSAMIAIYEGHRVRKVTFNALKRQGYAKDSAAGKPMLTHRGERFVKTGEISYPQIN